MRLSASSLLALALMLSAATAHADAVDQEDGVYGRLAGDLMLSAELGISETVGDERSRGESLAARASLLYLITAGLFVQYNESFDIDSQPITRSLTSGVELRPLFLGRWAEDTERGPALLDLWLDSLSLTLGLHNLWRHGRHCNEPGKRCHSYGMELSLGMELPLLPQASAPFIGFRGAVRWSLADAHGLEGKPPPMGLLTLSLGYHHLFDAHLVDAGDPLDP